MECQPLRYSQGMRYSRWREWVDIVLVSPTSPQPLWILVYPTLPLAFQRWLR